MGIVKAPFTEDQIKNLNSYQHSGAGHPFTCSGGGGPHSDLPERSAVLIAVQDGWHCPVVSCTHHQNWAHDWMADGSWRRYQSPFLKRMGFAPKLMPALRDGTKTVTIRLGEKFSELSSEDLILAENSEDSSDFCRASFEEIPIDLEGHETYESRKMMKDTFRRYYGRDIPRNEPVRIIRFRKIGEGSDRIS